MSLSDVLFASGRDAEDAEQVVAGKEVIGDVELFARAASEPLVAITGSNAKSTVTTLLGQVADAELKCARVRGAEMKAESGAAMNEGEGEGGELEDDPSGVITRAPDHEIG